MSTTNNIPIKDKLEKDFNFKISRFKEVIKRTSPHKHGNYYELIYLNKGEGFHWIDAQKIQINTPVVFLLRPEQVHYWEITAIPKGFVILVNEDFLNHANEVETLTLIRRLSSMNYLKLNDKDDLSFNFLFEEIEKEYLLAENSSAHIIHGYLKVLLGKIIQDDNSDNKPSQHHDKYLLFLQLLNTQPRFRKVKEYAGKLCITPQNLNVVCRRACDKNASEIINAQLLLEAKRLLLHTDKTVNEIAAELNFTDDSNFVKFFKSACKETPLKFKAKYLQ